ncbi:MAG TPA: ABC transporter ATP-binding protein [Chloroflexota bacterium]|jgi:ABC-2 type transport system ATP-binding protein
MGLTPLHPDPERWAVETFGLEKRFAARHGLPMDWGFGGAHWIISSLLKYRKKVEWHRAVDGVDLRVARGELFGLLGPNGAGKTTLLKCLATLLIPDGGEAFVNGYSVRTEPDLVKLSINLVGSGHWIAFDWAMTVRENLHFFGCLYGLGRGERAERIEAALARLGLEARANDTPRTLSAGERQRMLLAKGFIIRAPVFFLDEPTVGLDPEGAAEVREFIRGDLLGGAASGARNGASDAGYPLAGGGTSGILTTHRMNEAEALCRRVAIMSHGRIVACGTPLELKRLAGERSVLALRASRIGHGTLEAIRRLEGVRAAVASPSEGVDEAARVHCDQPERVAGLVVDLLRSDGAEVRALELEDPTLEDAFIALTREAAA